ncbi:MAG: amidohydrolase family protein, partial [Gammaproteobacteria bacterium]|nr:amidohydrolase family protein [Gammaproteobacteria bacterium]
DHAPHTLDEKAELYFKAPSGLPLVQHFLGMMLELVHEGHFELTRIVEKAAHNPARLFGIKDRGFIREGYYADFAIVDLAATDVVTAESLLYKCGWSPLEGETLHSRVVKTVLNGQVVFDRGRLIETRAALPLEFS